MGTRNYILVKKAEGKNENQKKSSWVEGGGVSSTQIVPVVEESVRNFINFGVGVRFGPPGSGGRSPRQSRFPTKVAVSAQRVVSCI